MNYKINGKKVTKKQWDAHAKRREATFGNLMDEMLSSQSAPRVMTDDVALAGHGTLDQQIKDPMALDYITKNAIKHGYRPKATDFYNSALAAFPGDPKAFLNHGQGRGHVKKTLEERGYVCKGGVSDDGSMVKVECAEPVEDPYLNPKLKLHPKIARRIRQEKIQENPDLARADQRELMESIVDERGWNQNR